MFSLASLVPRDKPTNMTRRQNEYVYQNSTSEDGRNCYESSVPLAQGAFREQALGDSEVNYQRPTTMFLSRKTSTAQLPQRHVPSWDFEPMPRELNPRHSRDHYVQDHRARMLESDAGTSCISADVVIPGRGKPIRDGVVVIKDNKIVYVGKQIKLPDEFQYAFSRRTHAPAIMPGFWDCHMHFTGVKDVTFPNLVLEHPAVCGARIVRNFYDCLMSGCTSVRDVGGFAIEAAQGIEDGYFQGPTVYGAGAAISTTGGSCDAYELPIGVVMSRQGVNAGTPFEGISQLALADGVDQCRKMVRLQLRRGAKCIKVITTGGVMSSRDDPKNQQFSREELKAMFEEAARAGCGIAAHAHGKPGVMTAVELGCTTIEHGTYIDAEAAELMKQMGTIFVPTRFVVEALMDKLDELDPILRRKILLVNETHMNAYRQCVAKGVKIALGTDIASGNPSDSMAPGNSGKEIVHAVKAGLTPLEAIEAGTANAAETLGPATPMSGQLKAGYDADIIALIRNPLDDIELFLDRDNVTHVWKLGKMVKSPTLSKSMFGNI